jgi:hypothetical protein
VGSTLDAAKGVAGGVSALAHGRHALFSTTGMYADASGDEEASFAPRSGVMIARQGNVS